MAGTLLDIDERTDEQLAAQATREESDGPSFLELMRRFRDRIWRICFRLMGNADDANDAAQEVFVRMFFHRARFQSRSKYSTWAHGVAVNTCLTMRRGRSRRVRRETKVAKQVAYQAVGVGSGLKADVSIDLNKMLDTLAETDRALLIMKYAEGQNYDELAATFGLSVSACKMRVSRAREKLKQRFPEHQF